PAHDQGDAWTAQGSSERATRPPGAEAEESVGVRSGATEGGGGEEGIARERSEGGTRVCHRRFWQRGRGTARPLIRGRGASGKGSWERRQEEGRGGRGGGASCMRVETRVVVNSSRGHLTPKSVRWAQITLCRIAGYPHRRVSSSPSLDACPDIVALA
ncbi:unnamed protein product, partial [Prorocentrum cordatum]